MAQMIASARLWGFLATMVLALSSMAGAVDIICYSATSACAGSAVTFNNVPDRTCVSANCGSVRCAGLDPCKMCAVFRSRDCTGSPVCSGTGSLCCTGGGYFSAQWYKVCRRRSLLAEVDARKSSECLHQAKPTGVAFTQDASKGTWVLDSLDALILKGQLDGLNDDEKVDWMKEQGARFLSASAFQT